jgi:hypothetical protein
VSVAEVFAPDWMDLLCREVLRERTGALVAEACAWAVGLSDQPHHLRRYGTVTPSGLTLGGRAESGLPLAGEEDGRIDLGDARAGSFQDALNALAADGALHADRFDAEVLVPFVHETCLLAAERARRTRGPAWAELADDVGADDDDLGAVVAAGGWEAPVRTEAEHRVLAALADVPLIEVEAEGLPLSLVRAAEAATRGAVPEPDPGPAGATRAADELAGARYLADAALRAAGLPVPVPPTAAAPLLDELLAVGLEPDEVAGVLPDLPLETPTVAAIAALLDDRRG